MPVPTKTPDQPKMDNQQKPSIPPHWRLFLLCALLICSVAVFINLRQPNTASDAAPVEAERVLPAEQAPVKVPSVSDNKANVPSIWPAKGAVTSGFGWRISPFGDGNEMHAGIDIASTMGAPVVATADGQVVQSGMSGGYGNMVQIEHGNGIATVYGHNSRLAVSVGQTVKKGQVIAFAGSTGKSTGPHVHYEIRENSTAIDPWKYLVLY